MSQFDVILGPIVFNEFEIPEHIPFGGRQMHIVNISLGGARTVDALGWDPTDIAWKGRFRGSNALARALELKALAETGIALPLTWDGQFFMVLIEKFEPEFEKHFEIPYSISLVVTVDPTQIVVGFAVSTLDQLVGADMQTAAGLLS